jgi:hypothetical protein
VCTRNGSYGGSSRGDEARDLAPRGEAGPRGPARPGSGEKVAAGTEVVADRAEWGEERLRVLGGLAVLARPVSSPGRAVGVLCPIGAPLVPPALDAGQDAAYRGRVAGQLIRDHPRGWYLLPATRRRRRASPASWLRRGWTRMSSPSPSWSTAYRPPQPVLAPVDLQLHLIGVPLVPRSGAAAAAIGKRLPETAAPAADRLVAHREPARRSQHLDVPVAQQEAVVQPHRVAAELPGQAVPLVAGRRLLPRGVVRHSAADPPAS